MNQRQNIQSQRQPPKLIHYNVYYITIKQRSPRSSFKITAERRLEEKSKINNCRTWKIHRKLVGLILFAKNERTKSKSRTIVEIIHLRIPSSQYRKWPTSTDELKKRISMRLRNMHMRYHCTHLGKHRCPAPHIKGEFETSYESQYKPIHQKITVTHPPPYTIKERHYNPDALRTRYKETFVTPQPY